MPFSGFVSRKLGVGNGFFRLTLHRLNSHNPETTVTPMDARRPSASAVAPRTPRRTMAPMHRPIAASTLSLSFRLGLRPPRLMYRQSTMAPQTAQRMKMPDTFGGCVFTLDEITENDLAKRVNSRGSSGARE